ncbi:MAG: hypothetical protein A2452_13600 [Candidatus Firestonebacteria bacterium RIFOXYC2_FULL_39_67]|nr:MAG: hypothetical protein A2452_13600 [Candidatus Firestonebacteria bacterium RIFOXYC2_FULL_39_67]
MIKLHKRKIIRALSKYLKDKETLVLHGARQVGKTSVLHYIMENVLKEEKKKNIFYFDLEDFALLELCDSGVENVVSYLKGKGADLSCRVFLFIDEIQYLKNPTSYIKLFTDRYKDRIKLVVSGSSSFLIKSKFKDSLAGRIIDFELFPLDFEEFLVFKKQNYKISLSLSDAINKELRKAYEEFVLFGGYPAVVLEEEVTKKEMKLKQLINTYIKKDIRDLANIREVEKFNSLVQLLASQTGNQVNATELANTLRLSLITTEEFLFLLENTYIVKMLRPFHKNIRSELTKMPKVYFEDNGLANLLANKTFSVKIDGNLLETSVFSQFRKNIDLSRLNYWRTANKQEVDFIIDGTVPVEVKTTFLNSYTAHLKVFMEKYGLKKGYVCCLKKPEESRNNGIETIYPWQVHLLAKT